MNFLNVKKILKKLCAVMLCLCCINTYVLADVPIPSAMPAPAARAIAEPVKSHNLPAPLQGRVVTVPAGSAFNAKMQSSVSSESLKPGDTVAAVLTQNWCFQGIVIAPEGSILYGKVLQVQQAGNAYKNGQFELCFNEVITPDGVSIALSSNTYALATDENRPLKIAVNVGKSALMGAALSGIANTDGENSGTFMLIGAGLGLLFGAVSTYNQSGENVELPRNTLIQVKLSQPVIVSAAI